MGGAEFRFFFTTTTNASRPQYIVIGLVDNEYTKLEKIGEKVLLILGLAHINLPLW